MTEEEPWQRYDRDKLPSGWAYPLGRDEVRAALVEAGVSLGGLSFSRTQPNRAANLSVLHVYWPSDARAKYLHSRDFNTSSSLMMLSVGSVPSHLRGQIGQQLQGLWLGKAVTWAHQAGWAGLSHGHTKRPREATPGRRRTAIGSSSESPMAGLCSKSLNRPPDASSNRAISG